MIYLVLLCTITASHGHRGNLFGSFWNSEIKKCEKLKHFITLQSFCLCNLNTTLSVWQRVVSLGRGSFSFLSEIPKKKGKVRMAKEQGIPEISAHPKVLQLGARGHNIYRIVRIQQFLSFPKLNFLHSLKWVIDNTWTCNSFPFLFEKNLVDWEEWYTF